MNGLSPIVIALSITQFFLVQAEVNVVCTDVKCPVISPEYFKDVDIHLLDEANALFVNFTLIKLFPVTGMSFLKLIAWADGDYSQPTGMEFSMPQCEAFKEPSFGMRLFKGVGIDPDVCPSLPGVYGNNKMELVDTSNLPDTFPANKYVTEFGIKDGEENLFLCKNYFTVE